MRLIHRCFIVVALVLAACERGHGQEAPDKSDDEARKQRLEYMKSFRSDFELFRGTRSDQPLNAVDDPIQRFSNPIRNFFSDCGVFLWLDGKRPVAVATVSIRGNGVVWFETASLSSGALRCLRKENTYWTPQSASLAEQRLTDAPPPAASPRSRLAQMRQLCEQFTFRTEPVLEKPTQLRLMPQPLFRFDDEVAGIIDGGLFAFAETTDPEALLLLEAVGGSGNEAPYWRFTVAKMTSRPTVAERNEKTVWSVGGYWLNPRSINDPYQERQLAVYPPLAK